MNRWHKDRQLRTPGVTLSSQSVQLMSIVRQSLLFDSNICPPSFIRDMIFSPLTFLSVMLCFYVCMCLCVCVFVYTCLCVYVCVWVFVYIGVFVCMCCVCICVYVFVCGCVYVCVYLCVVVCMCCVCGCLCICVCIYVSVYLCVYVYCKWEWLHRLNQLFSIETQSDSCFPKIITRWGPHQVFSRVGVSFMCVHLSWIQPILTSVKQFELYTV